MAVEDAQLTRAVLVKGLLTPEQAARTVRRARKLNLQPYTNNPAVDVDEATGAALHTTRYLNTDGIFGRQFPRQT